MIVEALPAHLMAAASFSDIAGDRLYPSQAPQGRADPFATFSLDFDESERLLDATDSSLRTAHISVDCYSLSATTAHQLALAVESVLVVVHGEMGSITPPQLVDDVRLTRKFALFENDTRLYRVSLQFAIAYYP